MAESCFGSATREFLNALTKSSRATYMPGLVRFQNYLSIQTLYPSVHTADGFLQAVLDDGKLGLLEQKFIDRALMKGFVEFLLEKQLKPKTVRTYVGGVQSLGTYHKIPISTAYAELPPAIESYEKHPWSIDKVGEFVKSMDNPMYRCLGVWYVQSGLSNWDLLHLTYGKVREQLDAGTVPVCLNLVRHKTRRFDVKFRTFIGDLGIRYFKDYIGAKTLADTNLLFPISDDAVEGYFKRIAAKFLSDGFTERNPCCPSSLRTAFRTFLADAECPDSYVEYFMGHNLTADLKKKYTNKSDESWRITYAKYEPVLTFKA